MNFENFKRHFEQFKKIETKRELDICKNQYEKYVKQLESDNYFEPHKVLNDYEKALFKIFDIQDITENAIKILIMPSFEPKKMLSIQSTKYEYALIFKVLEANYWEKIYNKEDSYQFEMKSYAANIDRTLGDKLFQVLRTAISEAKIEEKTYAALDGVVYILTQVIEGELISVKKHSPDETSRTGRIINLLENLSHLIAIENNEEILLKLENQINELLVY